MSSRWILATAAVAVAASLAATASAATNMFLAVTDQNGNPIYGDSFDKNHQRQIAVASFSIGVETQVVTGAGGKPTVGKPVFQPLEIGASSNVASVNLYKQLLTGQSFSTVQLDIVAPSAFDEAPRTFASWKLTNAYLTSFLTSSADDVPDETYGFGAFQTAAYTYYEYDETGRLRGSETFTWDLAKNAATVDTVGNVTAFQFLTSGGGGAVGSGGTVVPVSPESAVPEPTSLAVLGVVTLVGLGRRRAAR